MTSKKKNDRDFMIGVVITLILVLLAIAYFGVGQTHNIAPPQCTIGCFGS